MMSFHPPSTFLPSLAGDFEKFSNRHFWPAVIILFLFTIEFNGAALVPPEHYQRYAQHPFVTREDISPTNEWQDSILLPLTAFWIGATTRLTFNALCVGLLLLGYGAFLAWSLRRNGKTVAFLLFLMLLGHPVTAILWSWIGMPDCISFVCVALALIVRTRFAFFALAVISAMNHPAGAIAITGVVVLRFAAREEHLTIHHCLVVLAGALTGGVAVRAFNSYHEIHVSSRFDYAQATGAAEWLRLNLATLPSALFSFQQTSWFTLVFLVIIFARKDPAYFRALGIIMVVAFAITFFAFDTTRVFSLLTWGATFHGVSHCISQNRKEYGDVDAKTVLGVIEAFAIAGLLVPRFYVWHGEIFGTPFNSTVEMIRHIF